MTIWKVYSSLTGFFSRWVLLLQWNVENYLGHLCQNTNIWYITGIPVVYIVVVIRLFFRMPFTHISVNRFDLEDVKNVGLFRKWCVIPVLGLIENSLYDNVLLHNCFCLLLQIINSCSKVADLLLDNGLLYVLCNTLAALNGLETKWVLFLLLSNSLGTALRLARNYCIAFFLIFKIIREHVQNTGFEVYNFRPVS